MSEYTVVVLLAAASTLLSTAYFRRYQVARGGVDLVYPPSRFGEGAQ